MPLKEVIAVHAGNTASTQSNFVGKLSPLFNTKASDCVRVRVCVRMCVPLCFEVLR
jgi:hypothetical protein